MGDNQRENNNLRKKITESLKYENEYAVVISSSTIEIDHYSPHYFVYSVEEMIGKIQEG